MKKWAFLAIFVVVAYTAFLAWKRSGGVAAEKLTDLSDEARQKIADKIKGKPWYGTLVRIAADYDIPRQRIASIVAVESQGNEKAVGKAGELGLMQLMEPAIKDVYSSWNQSYIAALALGLDLFDAKTNLTIGTCYVAILKKRTGNLDQATQDFNDGGLNRGYAYLNEVKSFEKFF